MNERQDSAQGPNLGPLIAGLALFLVLLLFVVQNTESQQVSWLVFEVESPMWAILAFTAVMASLITVALSAVVRRRRR